MKHVQEMIETHGGLAAVKRNYLRIENPPFMRLVVEVVRGPMPAGTWELSVAHYGIQNGDAMRDPEVCFLVHPLPDSPQWAWFPLTFLNDYVGVFQQAATYDEDGILDERYPAQAREMREFADMWDRNIKHQGFIEAFQRKYGRTLNGAANGATSAVQ